MKKLLINKIIGGIYMNNCTMNSYEMKIDILNFSLCYRI